MEQKFAQFGNKGMYQDSSISKSSDEFAFKNVNIRITAVNDNTLFSVTNEKDVEELQNNISIVRKACKITISTITVQYPVPRKFIVATSEYAVEQDVEIELVDGDVTKTIIIEKNKLQGRIASNTNPEDYDSITITSPQVSEFDEFSFYLNGESVPEEQNVYTQTIKGRYIGKCILGDYLVVFTTTKEYSNGYVGVDRIYRLNIENNTIVGKEIYKGDINFCVPVETVGYYEREDIQKVYWVDGINQNRVINIVAEEQPDSFDFLPEINSIPTIDVEKRYDGSGSFASGTIQYFVSYYNKLGQETKIANASPLYYITNQDRGGSPDDVLSCSFNITLANLDNSFEYVRLYSAIRSSIDGPVNVRIVGDYTIPDGQSISIIDTGRNQEAIDATMLYYVGGDKFIASTIEDKDNVLFFGNIKTSSIVLTTEEIDSIKEDFKDSFSFEYTYNGLQYFEDFKRQDGKDKKKHFKYGNIYKFAIQFIDKSNQYSESIDICDLKCEKPPIYNSSDEQASQIIYIPEVKFTWPSNIAQTSSDAINKFVRYRILFAETSESTRVVVAQGIVNPTVFKLGDRVDNKGPYAIPSWITRPEGTNNSRHLEILGGHIINNMTGEILSFNPQRNHEISTINDIKPPVYKDVNEVEVNPSENSYYVDSSIITLNSPDIQYANNINSESLKFRIIGVTLNIDIYNDYNISYTNPNEIEKVGLSRIHRSMEYDENVPYPSYNLDDKNNVRYNRNNYSFGADTPVVISGDDTPSWANNSNYGVKDYLNIEIQYAYLNDDFTSQYTLSGGVKIGGESNLLKDSTGYREFKVGTRQNYLVIKTFGGDIDNQTLSNIKYLYSEPWKYGTTKTRPIISIWNKSGSLSFVDDNKNILESKIFSSYRLCGPVAYFESTDNYDNSESIIFNGESELLRLGDKYVSGNYDELIAQTDSYRYFYSPKYDTNYEDWGDFPYEREAFDPVRIRCKYTDCAIIELGNNSILPKILHPIAADISYNWTWRIGLEYGGNYSDTCKCYWDNEKNVDFAQNTIPANVWWYDDGRERFDTTYLNNTYCYYADNLSRMVKCNSKYLFIGELYKDINDSEVLYGASENIRWIPCGPIKEIETNTEESETEGDTFFQRWECLRAYPYAEGDENSVVDIVSFMVETYQNIDARYDRNRGYDNMNNARPSNYGLLNSAYNQQNNIFKYNTINETLQYANFPRQFAWSLNKNVVSEVDAWTSVTLSNIYNVDGSYGQINAIEKLNDTLIGFQDRAIFVINFNNRTQISTEQGLPIELANSGKVNGVSYITRNYGCKNKYSIANAKTGIYFIDDENRALIRIGKDGIADISTSSGMGVWFRKRTQYNKLWQGGEINDCFIVQYDSNRGDIYIMNGDSEEGCLVYNETLQTFTSFFSMYSFPLMYNFNGETYGLNGNNLFEQMFAGSNYNPEYSIEYRVNPEPLIDKTFTNIEYMADVYNSDSVVDEEENISDISEYLPFNSLEVWNEHQYATSSLETNKWREPDNKVMFRVRRAEIPCTARNYSTERIRNPWIHLKLSGNSDSLMQFHSLIVKYFK